MDQLEVDYTIIGAGVVGLAFAEALASAYPLRTVLVVERFSKFGQEISSHNSEVVHAGIYYQDAPLKAKSCVRGNALLYEFSGKYNVPILPCGKYVIADREKQLSALQSIYDSAVINGAPIMWVPMGELKRRLPHSEAIGALWSPSTGIIDSHVLMQRLQDRAKSNGAILLYNHTYLRLLDRSVRGLEIEVKDPKGVSLRIQTRAFVNCAGLASGRVASQFFPNQGIEVRACRGRYFSTSSRWTGKVKELLYPVPDPRGGLGVHVTFDLSGKCRLGPDVDSSRAERHEPDDWALYQFDVEYKSLQRKFFKSGRRLLKEIDFSELSPDYVGVRPKLYLDGVAQSDFLVKSGAGDWHFLGIESPGLTAALALAEKYFLRIAGDH